MLRSPQSAMGKEPPNPPNSNSNLVTSGIGSPVNSNFGWSRRSRLLLLFRLLDGDDFDTEFCAQALE